MHRKTETMRKELKLLGASVRHRRLTRGISQVQFAAQLGISNKQLNHVESARNWPSLPVYITLCRVFNAGKVPLVDDSTLLR